MGQGMSNDSRKIEDLSQEELARFIIHMGHRMAVHHTLWFREIEHQLGMERALDLLEEVGENINKIQMDRLGKTSGFEVKDGIPEVTKTTAGKVGGVDRGNR